MKDERVLLTGAAGFIGGHLLHALRTAPADPPALRLLRHHRPVDLAAPGDEVVSADLAYPASLRGICDGVSVLVHAAADLGDHAADCEAVNARGTEALVAEARRAGVQRMLYLSNAAVYGYATHRGTTEAIVTVAPATMISRSRVRAERAVLAHGGIVLRPLFVYGDGDQRFLPAIARALPRMPFLIRGGRARLSVIGVRELAVVTVRLAMSPIAVPSGAYHVTDGHPVTFRSIVDALAATTGTRPPSASVPYGIGRLFLRTARGGLLGGTRWSPSDDHRLYLVTHDHWYNDAKLRQYVSVPAVRPLPEQIPDHPGWCQSHSTPIERLA